MQTDHCEFRGRIHYVAVKAKCGEMLEDEASYRQGLDREVLGAKLRHLIFILKAVGSHWSILRKEVTCIHSLSNY